jgi:putative ABC transport system ATP-binding protein
MSPASIQRVPAVRIINAVKVYGSGSNAVRAVDGITIDFTRGEFTAVMGPSGSGKSTLLHCISGLDRLTEGVVELSGTNLSTLSDRQLTLVRRSKLGFVFQSYNLVPSLTMQENITLPLMLGGSSQHSATFDAIVDRLGLRDRLHHHPSELSGGQQQRAAIARALITEPEVIFADEPSGNLDTQSSAELLAMLRDAVDEHGQTIIMVTHDASAAAYADRVVFMVDGKVVRELREPTRDSVLDAMKEITE